MSMKGKARIEAVKAVGSLGYVRKVKGNIVVLPTIRGGRATDWQRIIKRAIEQILPNWQGKGNGWKVIFTYLPKGEKRS